jgi:hypothetical protein
VLLYVKLRGEGYALAPVIPGVTLVAREILQNDSSIADKFTLRPVEGL